MELTADAPLAVLHPKTLRGIGPRSKTEEKVWPVIRDRSSFSLPGKNGVVGFGFFVGGVFAPSVFGVGVKHLRYAYQLV